MACRHPELLLICLAFLLAFGFHRGLSPWRIAERHGEEQRTVRRRWDESYWLGTWRDETSTSWEETETSSSWTHAMGETTTSSSLYVGASSSTMRSNKSTKMGEEAELGRQSAGLQRFLEPILHPDGRWELVAGHWIWTDANLRQWNTSLKRLVWSKDSLPSTVWYGSSFLRELYLEQERLQHGILTRANCQSIPELHRKWKVYPPVCRLSQEQWHAMDAKYPAQEGADCLPPQFAQTLGSMSHCKFGNQMWRQKCQSWMGLEGIDLSLCGPPGFRFRPGMGLVIGFKTVLHSPTADDLFLSRLQGVDMRSARIAIVELGTAWGPRGERQPVGQTEYRNMSMVEEIQYYVHWVHTVAFPNRLVLWISACGCGQGGIDDQRQLIKDMWQEVQSHYKHAAVFVDKCVLADAKFGFETGHGCRGPLLNALAQILQATLLQVANLDA